MKDRALEILIGELIKDKPDLELIRREARRAGLKYSEKNLMALMAAALERSQVGIGGRTPARNKEMTP